MYFDELQVVVMSVCLCFLVHEGKHLSVSDEFYCCQLDGDVPQ